MQPVAIDTNAYSALTRADEGVVSVLRQAPEILVCSIVLGELLAGFAAGTREGANRRELAAFLSSPRIRQVSCGSATADRYALVFAALRRLRRPIPTNDMWVAASCLEHGAALLSLDGHFSQVGGLRVGARLEHFLP